MPQERGTEKTPHFKISIYLESNKCICAVDYFRIDFLNIQLCYLEIQNP